LNGYPDLGSGFSTNIPGLHSIGVAAARSFGPVLYFVSGTEFASKELGYLYLPTGRHYGKREWNPSSVERIPSRDRIAALLDREKALKITDSTPTLLIGRSGTIDRIGDSYGLASAGFCVELNT
jgi:hypothetical protein